MSSGRTGGGAPAHPSPACVSMTGGLYSAFMAESLVWQVMQLLLSTATVEEDSEAKKRSRARKTVIFVFIPPSE